MEARETEPLMRMQDIQKDFSGVPALAGITFDLYPGEVHCLVGENGAGKSTLMKVLSGAYQPSAGSIQVAGQTYRGLTPRQSRELGISIVYQENDLVPSMNVIENIYVGEELTSLPGLVNFKAQRAAVEEQLRELGISLNIDCKIEDLPISDQQFVKILKALAAETRILILDEPTSMFNVEDAHKVLELLRRISARGIGIVYISHFLGEVVQIADRITVMRDGKVVRTMDNSGRDTPLGEITREMVGRPVEMFFTKERVPIGEVILEARDLRLRTDGPAVSFQLHRGEILGFSGMVGSGRTEIMRAVAGADRRAGGEILIHGQPVDIQTPEDGIAAGIAFITEDRQLLGLSLGASVAENAALVGLRDRIPGFFVNPRRFGERVGPTVEGLRLKAPSLDTPVVCLSGGNQQKVVLAKWLFAQQEIYIFDEPTRGIDVNAKAEFYKEMTRLTAEGKCILLVSSDMPELISMSDRVLVVRDGEITDELTGEVINEQEIVKRALGVNKR